LDDRLALPLQLVVDGLRRHHALGEQRCRHAVTGHHDERDPALGGGVGGVRDRAGGGGGAVDADDDGVLEGCHTPRLPLFATVGRRIYRSSGNGELDGEARLKLPWNAGRTARPGRKRKKSTTASIMDTPEVDGTDGARVSVAESLDFAHAQLRTRAPAPRTRETPAPSPA